jgi:hypothetical protein
LIGCCLFVDGLCGVSPLLGCSKSLLHGLHFPLSGCDNCCTIVQRKRVGIG